MHSLLFGVTLLSILVLCSCGGGGGGSSDETANNVHPVNPPPAGGVDLGSRAVPGYTVQAARMSAVLAGQPITIRIVVTPVADQPLPDSVEGWASSEFDAMAVAIPATAVADQPGVYEASIPLSDPLPTTCAFWTRLRLADGSVLELGREDFRLSAAP